MTPLPTFTPIPHPLTHNPHEVTNVTGCRDCGWQHTNTNSAANFLHGVVHCMGTQ